MGSRKRASISVGTFFAIMGVTLGVAALVTIMSVTGGFHHEFREKVLGVNAHVLVLKYSTNFREYRSVMEKVAKVDGIIGVAPFSINPMMLNHKDATATGVLVKGVDPKLSLGVDTKASDEWKGKYDGMQPVLDLPKYIIAGSLDNLRKPGARPAESKFGKDDPFEEPSPSSSALRGPLDDPAPSPSASGSALPDEDPDPGGFAGGSRMQPGAPSAAKSSAPPEDEAEDDEEYASELPEEDVLPPDVDPDPCEDPDAVKQLPGVVVGASLAKTLGLAHEVKSNGDTEWKLGDCITITSPTIGFSFSGGQIKPPVAKRFRVIAVFEAGFDQYDSKLVYTDLYEAQTFYDHGDTVTGIEMKVDNIDRAGKISNDISALLASGLYHTMDWMELNHGLFTALTIQQWGMSAVLALIIVVAAFTVVATLIMVVLDKQKEISVLKAMGATDSAILRIFLYQGGLIGLFGTSLGLILGLVVCKGLLVYGFPLDPKVYFISRLPVQLRVLEFVVTGAIALVICLIATIIPSLYAASLRPADGFRNQ
jgi:lipoprotein-releasing system permease protein